MQIPMGDFGNRVARPGVLGSIPDGGASALQAAAARTGQIAMNVVNDMAERRTQLEIEQRDKAEAAETITAAAEGKAELRRLHDEFSNGVKTRQIDKTKAVEEWASRSRKFVDSYSPKLPPSRAHIVHGQLLEQALQLSDGVRSVVQQQDRDDTRAGLMSYLEMAERDALTNRPEAVARGLAAIEQLGPWAGLGADDQQRLAQNLKERTAFALGRGLVNGARDDRQGLDNVLSALKSEQFADLAPERLGQLEQQILARQQALESREQTRVMRAEAAAARRHRAAEAAVVTTQNLIENGGMPDEPMVALVAAKVAGTEFAPVFTQLLQQAGQDATFAQMTPQQQQAAILSMRATANERGTNPRLEAQIAKRERIAASSLKQLQEDPLVYGQNRRLIELAPLDFQSLDDLPAQLKQRVEQAQLVSARTKVPVSPLLASEAARAAEMLAMLPLPARRMAVGNLAQALDPASMAALSAQIGKTDDTLGLSMYASKFLPPDTADLILRGQDAVKAGRIKSAGNDAAAGNDHREIARRIAQVPWPTQKARDQATRAAQLAYDGQRDLKGSASVKDAITRSTGEITEWNGSKVPMPPGMEEHAFRRAVQRLDVAALTREAGGEAVLAGGKPLAVSTLVANIATVKLVPAGGPGVYALDSGGQLILRQDGRPLRITIGGR